MEITELIGSSEYISGACSSRASLRGNLIGPISISLVYSHIFWDSQISKSRLPLSCLQGSVLGSGEVGWSQGGWRSSNSACK